VEHHGEKVKARANGFISSQNRDDIGIKPKQQKSNHHSISIIDNQSK